VRGPRHRKHTQKEFPLNRAYYFAIAVYCGLIFWLSHQSSPIPVEMRFPGEDKVAHIILYGGLAGLVSIGLHRAPKTYPQWVLRFGPILFAGLYGLSDELHQSFVPMRSASALDLVADVVGATMAHAVCTYYFRRRGALADVNET